MKVLDPGHVYDLDWLDGEPARDLRGVASTQPDFRLDENRLIFVKREGSGYPGNVGHHPGTNMQEVLRALIDRVKYLDQQVPHYVNELIIEHLRMSLFYLEDRAAERHHREPTFDIDTPNIEELPVCVRCGHIGCEGICHAS
jgi:hypothetical protein